MAYNGQKIKQVKSWDEYLKDKKKVEVFKRRLRVIKDISIESTMEVMEAKSTHAIAASVGVAQGLKYNGSLSRGIKAGAAMYGVMVGVNVIQNLVVNRDAIKNA